MIKSRKMKTYYLKIREKFIDLLKIGVKKHEYRLASPERQSIRIGDNLVLISNQNNKKYVRTTVTGINIYKSWQEALEKHWEEDFAGLFDTLDTALTECYRFYPRSEVERYGIIVFDVKPAVIDYRNASVLLDTNIIIKRESSNNASSEVSILFNWFDKKRVSKYIHQITISEINKYGNSALKNSILTKLKSYDVLASLPTTTDEYFKTITSKYSKDINSENDNALLLETYNDNIQLLVTDDSLMLKKAEELFIRDRVLSSYELLTKYESDSPTDIDYKVLNVKLTKFNEVDVNNSFFETLREDYEGQKFDRWFKRKALEGKQAYVSREAETLKGFLYLKVEDESEDYGDINPIFRPAKRLKIGTFKVVSTGYRLGERFIKIIVDKAVRENVDEIYVTLFEKREEVKALQNLLSSWGFRKYGYKKSNGELVMVKNMKTYDYAEDPKFNYPLIKDNAKYRFLPIKAEYHTELFPDNILKDEDASLYEGNFAHRYAQEKIYLTGAKYTNAKPGDVVLIYRMSDRMNKRYSSVITGRAIIQGVKHTKNVEECVEICKDRSIFKEKDIRTKYDELPVVVKLLALDTFIRPVNLNFLRENGIIEEGKGPRPFMALTKEEFDLICKKGTGEE